MNSSTTLPLSSQNRRSLPAQLRAGRFLAGLLTCSLFSLSAASAQTHQVVTPGGDANVYGGHSSGVYITGPAGQSFTVVISPAVIPGGPGTEPGHAGELGGWNGSTSELSGQSDSTETPSVGSDSFGKQQTIKVKAPTAPHEMHWECQGTASVGGKVSAQMTEAHGTCHAAGHSKTVVVYGGTVVVAEDEKGVALAHVGSGSVGGSIWILGFNITYDAAGSSAEEKTINDSMPGPQARASSAIIKYVQDGDSAYSIEAAIDGGTAKAELKVEAKGSAEVNFFLLPGF